MDTIPKSYFCSITQELMKDPVMDPEGNSYEKAAIEQWLQRNSISPITRTRLEISSLVPNRALKDGIQELLRQHPELKAASKSATNDVIRRQPVEITTNAIYYDNKLLVNVKVPESSEGTAPTDVVVTIDVSGSMGTDASITVNGTAERDGLSQLDIVVHAVKTIIATLSEKDRLCIVTYHTQAKLELDFTYMNCIGKQTATHIIEQLKPQCTTNIWDGLHTSLEAIRERSRPGCNSAIILLTDGIPNIIPPRGHLPMLDKYLDQYSDLNTVIHTCGFGYQLDSELLDQFSKRCYGMYTFIPDSSMVGTIMVNLVSNILATAVKDVKVNLNFDTPTQLLDHNLENLVTTSWGAAISVGNISYGQTRDLVIPINNGDDILISIDYRNHGQETTSQLTTEEIRTENSSYLQDQVLRDGVVHAISHLMNYVTSGETDQVEAHLKLLGDRFEAITEKTSYSEDLYQDVVGQITQAVTNLDWFNKWGKHYLPSLKRAHQLQLCNNFKDPGVQHYGAKLFRQLRDEADELFCKLPPPKPSNYVRGASMPVNISNYNNNNNPCFAGSCLVMMADGNTKRVDKIKKGDLVKCQVDSDQTASVRCVLKTICAKSKANLVLTETGLLITPWHPILCGEEWEFPANLEECNIEYLACNAVYSFVLDRHHTISINQTTCVTLGHDFVGPVISHPYFGSQQVVGDLENIAGWSSGLVTITSDYIRRDPVSGYICAITKPK